jgi:quercetin dioxygenase-like cupin family protein
MRYRTTIIGSAFVFIAVAALWVARASAASSPASAGVIQILSQQPLAGRTGTDVTILTVDYPPGGSTPPHEHPGTTYAYVLQGSVVSKLDDGPTQTFTKGQMWTEQPARTVRSNVKGREQKVATTSRDFKVKQTIKPDS